MSLNLMIMSADEVIRWYTPANAAEQYLHNLLGEAAQRLAGIEEEKDDELTKLDDEIADLKAAVDRASDKIDNLEDELFEERERVAELTKELDAIRDSVTV